jgi:hypothetical protein
LLAARAGPAQRQRRDSGFDQARRRASNPGVPLVALVFPVAALAATDVGQAGHQLDRADVFGLLVAELALDAAAQRRAVADRQGLVVELVGQDRLRVVGVVELDALVMA